MVVYSVYGMRQRSYEEPTLHNTWKVSLILHHFLIAKNVNLDTQNAVRSDLVSEDTFISILCYLLSFTIYPYTVLSLRTLLYPVS